MRPGADHARHHKKIIINEGRHEQTGGKILCAWEDCPRDAYDLYKVAVNYGTAQQPYVTWYAFCCERHLAFFVNSHRDNGKLPAGLRHLSVPR